MNIAFAEPDGRLALAEANHRFLNTLSALGGLLRNDFGDFADPAVHDAVRLFSSRIHAFAEVHRSLGGRSGEAMVDAPAHLARLCSDLCEAHLAPRGLHCEFSSDPGELPREMCQTLSLIVVELITNAAKHAFAGRGSGRVRVALRRTDAAWFCHVADDGSGLRGGRSGEGMRLVRGLVKTMGGALRIQSGADGVIVSIRVPEAGVSPKIGARKQLCPA